MKKKILMWLSTAFYIGSFLDRFVRVPYFINYGLKQRFIRCIRFGCQTISNKILRYATK